MCSCVASAPQIACKWQNGSSHSSQQTLRGSYRQPNKKQRKRSTPDYHSGRYGSTGELTEVVTKYGEIGFTETKTDDFLWYSNVYTSTYVSKYKPIE